MLLQFIELVQKIEDANLNDEKRVLASTLFDMLFTAKEVLELMTMVDEGYTSSQIIKSLKYYDLTEHHDQIHAAKDIRSPSKMKEILKRMEKGIFYH